MARASLELVFTQTTLNKITKDLKNLKKEASTISVGKPADINKQVEGIKKLNTETSKHQSKLKTSRKLIESETKALKALDAQTRRNTTSVGQLAKGYVMIAGLRKTLGTMNSELNTLKDLDKAVYNLGVVSKKSASEIEDLKFQLLDMGSKFPFQAKSIAEAMDTIGRTGISFADNLESIDDAMRLAVSSGAGLNDVAGINCSSVKISLYDWKVLRAS